MRNGDFLRGWFYARSKLCASAVRFEACLKGKVRTRTRKHFRNLSTHIKWMGIQLLYRQTIRMINLRRWTDCDIYSCVVGNRHLIQYALSFSLTSLNSNTRRQTTPDRLDVAPFRSYRVAFFACSTLHRYPVYMWKVSPFVAIFCNQMLIYRSRICRNQTSP